MLSIPRPPKTLSLVVDALWNATACPKPLVRAKIDLSSSNDGLRLSVAMPRREEERVPEAPVGARVEGLWNFDVVEVFLRGPGDQYLEIELGPGGHYLVLGFNGVRNRIADFKDRPFNVVYQKNSGQWTSEITIPWNIISNPVRSLNAYVIAEGEFFALSPVPGVEPDFHQPEAFVPCEIEN